MTTPLPQPPDAFDCPYRRQCWQRETFRWVAVILVAALTAWFSGCALKLRGPGVDLDWSVPWPSATTQPTAN